MICSYHWLCASVCVSYREQTLHMLQLNMLIRWLQGYPDPPSFCTCFRTLVGVHGPFLRYTAIYAHVNAFICGSFIVAHSAPRIMLHCRKKGLSRYRRRLLGLQQVYCRTSLQIAVALSAKALALRHRSLSASPA